ncbi:MAG: hypothetical protein C4334_08855 [Pyrinomonas sp.]
MVLLEAVAEDVFELCPPLVCAIARLPKPKTSIKVRIKDALFILLPLPFVKSVLTRFKAQAKGF